MSYFFYALFKRLSGLKGRVRSLSKFEESIFNLIDEIEIYAKKFDYNFNVDDKKLLKKYLVRYCSLIYKTKPNINSRKYAKYNNYTIQMSKYKEAIKHWENTIENTINETMLGEKAIKSIRKNKRDNFRQIREIVHKFPNLQNKIFDLIKYLEEYSKSLDL